MEKHQYTNPMQQARRFLQNHHYQEAIAILETIDTPRAKKWLKQAKVRALDKSLEDRDMLWAIPAQEKRKRGGDKFDDIGAVFTRKKKQPGNQVTPFLGVDSWIAENKGDILEYILAGLVSVFVSGFILLILFSGIFSLLNAVFGPGIGLVLYILVFSPPFQLTAVAVLFVVFIQTFVWVFPSVLSNFNTDKIKNNA